MAKYDLYTDVVFALQVTTCEKQKSRDLGIICLVMILINYSISFWTQRSCFVEILRYKRKKPGEIHNTAFINQYTKLALI